MLFYTIIWLKLKIIVCFILFFFFFFFIFSFIIKKFLIKIKFATFSTRSKWLPRIDLIFSKILNLGLLNFYLIFFFFSVNKLLLGLRSSSSTNFSIHLIVTFSLKNTYMRSFFSFINILRCLRFQFRISGNIFIFFSLW